MNYTSIPTFKSSLAFVNKALTECILNLLDPSTAGGWGRGQLLPIFIDLVSTDILLAMLGFPLSPKGHADFCFKPSWLFFLNLFRILINFF